MTTETPAPARAFHCRCGVAYVPAAFARLEPVRVLDMADIAPLVVRWPEDTVVDVRACSGCAAPIARLARR
ncbi:MAG: hypothetical protein JWP87_1642 [Labilithrix sp.]|nr:hypothetical protein [Labilithrix sp.]